MAFCTECGAAIAEGMRFCTECGAPAPVLGAPEPPVEPAREQPEWQEPVRKEPVRERPARQVPVQEQPRQRAAAAPAPAARQGRAVDRRHAAAPTGKYELISTGGMLGVLLLLCIPVVGLILTIVWACGGCRKKQKSYLARAMLLLMAIALVLSVAAGLVLHFALGISFADMFASGGGSGGLFTAQDEEPGEDEGGIISVLGGLGGLGGESEISGQGEGGAVGGTEEQLSELEGDLAMVDAMLGEGSDLSGLIDNIEDINEEAEHNSSGWPSYLPDFPGGEMEQDTSYRTLFHGATREHMQSYVQQLKAAGFEYTDFYEFGMTEEDMLSFDGWWGTDGRLYLSVSYYEGTVTIDHTTELPRLEDYFG